jgi:hypothetical protein
LLTKSGGESTRPIDGVGEALSWVLGLSSWLADWAALGGAWRTDRIPTTRVSGEQMKWMQWVCTSLYLSPREAGNHLASKARHHGELSKPA